MVRVSLDGSIQLPLIGTLHVQGLTIAEAQKLIADTLIAAGMY
ncbi:polysaccharide biosynthesis/export family protein, partial [Edaphobacter sp. HDX4]